MKFYITKMTEKIREKYGEYDTSFTHFGFDGSQIISLSTVIDSDVEVSESDFILIVDLIRT